MHRPGGRIDHRKVLHDLPENLERSRRHFLMQCRDALQLIERFCEAGAAGCRLMICSVLAQAHYAAANVPGDRLKPEAMRADLSQFER